MSKSNMDLRISVVVPLFNKDYIVKKTIYSILNQTFPPYEVIIIDDGSKDDSKAIVDSLLNERGNNSYRLVSTTNKGVSSARNLGVSLSTGDYVCFLDADDFWSDRYLETLSELIRKFPSESVFSTQHCTSMKTLSIGRVDDFVGDSQVRVIKNFYLSSLRRSLVNSSKICVKKSLFLQYEGFPESASVGEDLYFWMRILERNTLVHTKANLVLINTIYDSSRESRYLKIPYPLLKGPSEFSIKPFSVRLYLYRIALVHLADYLIYRNRSSESKYFFEYIKRAPIASLTACLIAPVVKGKILLNHLRKLLNRQTLKTFMRKFVRSTIGPVLYTKLRFRLTHRHWLNLTSPKSFNEKIQFRKFNVADEALFRYVDKLEVRSYVREKIGEQYLIPLLFHGSEISGADLYRLPKPYVIKTSNGGGGNNVQFIYESVDQNLSFIAENFNRMVKEKVGTQVDESFYDYKSGSILVEKLLTDSGSVDDFKIHIFNNESKTTCFIQVDRNRFTNHSRSIFDESLKRTDFCLQPKYSSVPKGYTFPLGISEAIEKAKLLATPFSYVRVDMYILENQIYFGELTFCHGSGWEPFLNLDDDFSWGALWSVGFDGL